MNVQFVILVAHSFQHNRIHLHSNFKNLEVTRTHTHYILRFLTVIRWSLLLEKKSKLNFLPEQNTLCRVLCGTTFSAHFLLYLLAQYFPLPHSLPYLDRTPSTSLPVTYPPLPCTTQLYSPYKLYPELYI